MVISFVDGQEISAISIDDRGLAYGDGCFTTALVTHGEVVIMRTQHRNRLVQQSQQLRFT